MTKKLKSFDELAEVVQPEYIALRDITIHAKNCVIQRYQPFPSGIEGVDYNSLVINKFIATFAEFQRMDQSGRCLSCGD